MREKNINKERKFWFLAALKCRTGQWNGTTVIDYPDFRFSTAKPASLLLNLQDERLPRRVE
jgi:hypothetical protein